jgi:hypothetical protein
MQLHINHLRFALLLTLALLLCADAMFLALLFGLLR